MTSRMKHQAIAAVLIVLCADICLKLLSRADSPERFVPFLATITRGSLRISMYDVFFVGFLFLARHMVQRFHVNRQSITAIANLRPVTAAQAAAIIFIAMFTHLWLWPVLAGILHSPLSALRHSPDAVRRCIIAFIPFTCAVALAVIARNTPPAPISIPRASTGSVPQSPQTW